MSSAGQPLYEFLNEPTNSHAKEALLMHRLCFDLKLAAANNSYYLNTYWDDVDHDGFDLIFDDQYSLRKTQVKSVGKMADTATWDIHKRILRPPLDQIDLLGLEPSKDEHDDGVAGGVILMEYRVEDGGRLEVDYYYTDLYILLAFKYELMRRTHGGSRNAITTCLGNLCQGKGSERLKVPRAAFVQAQSPAALLALLSLRSTEGHNWKLDVIQIVRTLHAVQTIPTVASPLAFLEFKQPLLDILGFKQPLFFSNFIMMVKDQDLRA